MQNAQNPSTITKSVIESSYIGYEVEEKTIENGQVVGILTIKGRDGEPVSINRTQITITGAEEAVNALDFSEFKGRDLISVVDEKTEEVTTEEEPAEEAVSEPVAPKTEDAEVVEEEPAKVTETPTEKTKPAFVPKDVPTNVRPVDSKKVVDVEPVTEPSDAKNNIPNAVSGSDNNSEKVGSAKADGSNATKDASRKGKDDAVAAKPEQKAKAVEVEAKSEPVAKDDAKANPVKTDDAKTAKVEPVTEPVKEDKVETPSKDDSKPSEDTSNKEDDYTKAQKEKASQEAKSFLSPFLDKAKKLIKHFNQVIGKSGKNKFKKEDVGAVVNSINTFQTMVGNYLRTDGNYVFEGSKTIQEVTDRYNDMLIEAYSLMECDIPEELADLTFSPVREDVKVKDPAPVNVKATEVASEKKSVANTDTAKDDAKGEKPSTTAKNLTVSKGGQHPSNGKSDSTDAKSKGSEDNGKDVGGEAVGVVNPTPKTPTSGSNAQALPSPDKNKNKGVSDATVPFAKILASTKASSLLDIPMDRINFAPESLSVLLAEFSKACYDSHAGQPLDKLGENAEFQRHITWLNSLIERNSKAVVSFLTKEWIRLKNAKVLYSARFKKTPHLFGNVKVDEFVKQFDETASRRNKVEKFMKPERLRKVVMDVQSFIAFEEYLSYFTFLVEFESRIKEAYTTAKANEVAEVNG